MTTEYFKCKIYNHIIGDSIIHHTKMEQKRKDETHTCYDKIHQNEKEWSKKKK